LLDTQSKDFNPLKAVQVLASHAELADTTPEVKQANLAKVREVVQGIEAKTERSQALLDSLVDPTDVEQAKAELPQLTAQLAAVDQADTEKISKISEAIKFREDLIALSGDKVAVKRIQHELKRDESQLNDAKVTQERLAGRLRKSVSVGEVAAHLQAANKTINSDDMPDLEASRQSADTLINLMTVEPGSMRHEDATALADNTNNGLTAAQRNYFREFSKARIAENAMMDLEAVTKTVMEGDGKNRGIKDYHSVIGQAIEANDKQAANTSIEMLSRFAASHEAKLKIASELFAKVKHSGDKQVLKVKKTNSWEVVPAGKPMSKKALDENGGFTIHPNSVDFVAAIRAESQALNQAVNEHQAAYALKFGGTVPVAASTTPAIQTTAAPTSVAPVVSAVPAVPNSTANASAQSAPKAVTPVDVVNTSVPPVQKEVKSVQITPLLTNPPTLHKAYQQTETAKLAGADLIIAPASNVMGYAGSLGIVAKTEGKAYDSEKHTDLTGKTVLVSVPGGSRNFKQLPELIQTVMTALNAGATVRTDIASMANSSYNRGGEGMLRSALVKAGYVEAVGIHYSSWTKPADTTKAASEGVAVANAASGVEAATNTANTVLPTVTWNGLTVYPHIFNGMKKGEYKSKPLENNPAMYEISYITKEGEKLAGTYWVEGSAITDFNITSEHGKGSLGIGIMRTVLNNIVKQHPEITDLYGSRISGVRQQAQQKDVDVHFKITNGKAVLVTSTPSKPNQAAAQTQQAQVASNSVASTPQAETPANPAVQSASTPPSSNVSVKENAEGEARPKTDTTSKVKATLMEVLDRIKTGISSVGPAKFVPNKEQADGIAKIRTFLTAPRSQGNIFVLEGKAGTGKTSLVQEAVALHLKAGNTVTVAAVSHKAKGVLEQKLGKFISANKLKGQVEAHSLAGLLGMKPNIETGNFELDPYAESAIENVSVLVVDEASMVNAQNKAILEARMPHGAKLIYLGDRNQVAPIEAKNSPNEGEISQVFTMNAGKNKHSLVTRVRQGEDSTILPYADHYWNNAENKASKADPVPATARRNTSEIVMLQNNNWIEEVIPLFQRALTTGNANLVKVMAFNNILGNTSGGKMLLAAERKIREAMFGKDLLEYNKGELLIMTGNFGNPEKDGLANSAELVAMTATPTQITLTTPDNKVVLLDAFNLKVKDTNTGDIKTVPVLAASARDAHRKLYEAWSNHAKTKDRGAWNMFWAIKDKTFAPVAYAYILTTHKAQGSTYDTAVVLEDNIQGSPGTAANVSRLMYTAITRASKLAVIVSNKNQEQDTTQEIQKEQSKADPVEETPEVPAWSDAEYDAEQAASNYSYYDQDTNVSTDPVSSAQVLVDEMHLNPKFAGRTFSVLTKVQNALLTPILKEFSKVFEMELDVVTLLAQKGYKAKGTMHYGYDAISINEVAFLDKASKYDASITAGLRRILSHELAHTRDELLGFASEKLAVLQPGGIQYEEAFAAMRMAESLDPKDAAYILFPWFSYMIDPAEGVHVQHELYAQLHALYLNQPELMRDHLTETYQAYQQLYKAYPEAVAAKLPRNDKAGSTKAGGQPASEEDTRGTDSDGVTRRTGDEVAPEVSSNAGGLTALVPTEANPKTTTEKDYRARNLFLDHFSQTVAGLTATSQRPLVAVKDFIDGVTDFAVHLSKNSFTASEQQLRALNNFRTNALDWKKIINGNLKLESDRYKHNSPFNWLIAKGTPYPSGKVPLSVESNVSTAISYAATSMLLEMADAAKTHDDKAINAILGRSDEAAVPVEAYELLSNKGVRANVMRNSVGPTAVTALGLKADKDAPQNLMSQLEGSFGAHVERLLLTLGFIERVEVSVEDMNAVLAITNEIDGKSDKDRQLDGKEVHVFMRLMRDENGDLVQGVKDILEASKGSNGILDKLFSVETGLEYPSFTALVNTQTTTKTGQQIPDLLNDTNDQNRNQENFAREDSHGILAMLADKIFGGIAGVTEISKERTQVTKHKSLTAKNEGLWREINRYKEYMDLTLIPAGFKQAIHFDYSVWLQQRVGIKTNVINPQTSKVHRVLFYRSDWESKVDLGNADMLTNFFMRVGEGFGIKTDRQNITKSMMAISAMFENPIINTAIEDLQSAHYDKKPLTEAQQDNLLAAVQLGGENMHTFDVLLAMAHYRQAEDKGESSFTTHIQAEVDGVANGPILAHALFGAAATVDALNLTLSRGGIYTEKTGQGETEFHAWKDKAGNHDLYENTMISVKRAIAQLALENPDLARAVEYFTGKLSKGEFDITSAGRNAIKPPVTEMVFGSGIATSLAHMADGFTKKIYDVFEASANGEKNDDGELKYPKETVIEMINTILANGGSNFKLKMGDPLIAGYFDKKTETNAINTAFATLFADPVKDTVEANFGEFLARRDVFNQAASLAHGLYATVYDVVREDFVAQGIAQEKKEENTGIPFEKGTNQAIRDLSTTEERVIEKQLKGMFPAVATLFSLESNQPKAGLRIGKFKRRISTKRAYESTVKFASNSVTVRSYEETHEEPGVGMLALMIHSLDSYISHATQMGMQLLNIHDAVITGLKDIKAASTKMNEKTFHALLNYSPMYEMYKALETTVLGLDRLDADQLPKETAQALANYLDGFEKEFKVEGDNILLAVLTKAKAEAAAADKLKLEAMLEWVAVNQYAREGSSYMVTPTDIKAIEAKLAAVNAELSATVTEAAQSIDTNIRVTLGLPVKVKPAAKKAVQSDDMPDMDPPAATTATVEDMGTQEIYAALGTGAISASFDKHLTNVLSNIVNKLHGAFDSFKASLATHAPTTAVDVYAQSLATGKAPFGMNVGKFGLKVDSQQLFVADQVYATMLSALSSKDGRNEAVYREIGKLFKETKTRLTVQDFNKGDLAAAQATYDMIFNQQATEADGHSNYLAEFAALGLANEEVNKLLQVPTKMAPAILKDKTIAGMLKRAFNKALEMFNGKLTHTKPGQQADKKLQALVEQLVEIENKRYTTLKYGQSTFGKFIDTQMDSLRMGKKSALSSIAHSEMFMKSKNVYVAAASSGVAILADSQVRYLFQTIEQLRNEHFTGIQGVTQGFLTEMNGPKPLLQSLLRAVKGFEKLRKTIISQTNKFVLETFDEAGKNLTDFDKRAVTKVLLHTGAHVLLDHGFDTNKIATVLQDKVAMNKEIAKLESQLNAYDVNHKEFFVAQSKALGFFLVTGKVTLASMLRNANNIARMYTTQYQGRLTEAEVAEATKTIDALSTLYAMAYTTQANKDSVIKTLEKEHQRNDSGNGVRMVLLSHKEAEQQSKERLFSESAALMGKGYMPEIYNPHTDIKVADEKEGKALEDLGYKRVAGVEKDPSDHAKTSKSLYVLQDGGKLPWLSGILSFTGMQAKGTKHHGNVAQHVQQALTQSKQKAIAALHQAGAGAKFDPTQVAENFMAPLMNDSGDVVNYQYLMHSSTKDNLLERDDRFDSVMGMLAGSIFDKENSAVNNRKAIQVFHDEFVGGYVKEPKAFIKVSATSADPELREIYKMLPKSSKDAIREIWGKDEMLVRTNALDIAFGYRKLSLSTAFDKSKEERDLMDKSLVWFSEKAVEVYARIIKQMKAEDAKKYAKRTPMLVRKSEAIWQEVVHETKDIFVTKSGITLLNNIGSNTLLLKLYGVGTLAGIRDMQIAWVGAESYTRDSEKLFNLQKQLDTKSVVGDTTAIKAEIAELKDALSRNPVRKLLEAGLMPTIVEDVGDDTDQFSHKNVFARDTKKYTDKLNSKVKAVAKQVYMAHDTTVYKTLSHITQLSDFVARYALYQHLTTMKNPLTEAKAIQEVSDAFVNYDVPMHRKLQYMDDMGVMMFTKYFMRIQRVIRGRFKYAPGKTVLLMVAGGYLDWIPSVIDSSILFKFGNNPFGWGALQFPGALDELLTAKLGLSLFK